MGENGLTVADALALQDRGNSNNDGMFGGAQGAWWVIILILFFAFAGWAATDAMEIAVETVVQTLL